MNSTQENTASEKAFFEALRHGRHDEIRQKVAGDRTLLSAYDYGAFGATPITSLAFQGDRDSIDLLLELGADIDRRSNWWAGPWSPLHCAIHGGDDGLAEYLLERGATLDVHTAASLGRLDELRRFLDESPERVHERGGDGCQPLHFAGTPEAAQLLLDRGADIEARDVDHYSTPVQYLCRPRPAIARFLFSKGATPDIFSAVLADDLDVVRRLQEQNADVIHERVNQERFPPGPEHDVHNVLTFMVGMNSTPLHAAASGNRPAMIAAFLDAGIDVNIRGGYDDATALHFAAWENALAVAERLLAGGADINARSGKIHNNSPAGWAIVAGSDQVFELLMDHGAEVLDFFVEDAQAAVAGEFRPYKVVPQVQYERVLTRLTS